MVSTYLTDYLDRSRLSLSQLADKLGISKGYLSDIKNKKKIEPIHLGAKILKSCGAPDDIITSYVEKKQELECRIYAEVRKHINSVTNEKLAAEEVSNKIATDIELFNAYHEIGNENSVAKDELAARYGATIFKKLTFLVDRDFIELRDGMYCIDEQRHTLFTSRSVFKVLITAIQNEANQYDVKENMGITRFYCHEIASDAMSGLNELKKKHYEEEVAFMDKHLKTVKKGGIRVFTASVSTCLQRSLLIVGLLVFTSNVDLLAGPGGSSSGGTDPQDGNPSLRVRIRSSIKSIQRPSTSVNKSTSIGNRKKTLKNVVKSIERFLWKSK